ncbi:hemolysin D [Acinetobacter tandoii]|uniref:efflux RND transporter periplasmic adaptor subunit n=1 Tax=Acinetobacter tandoii TaxID=202954 RepID=UPI000C1FEFB1|nr:efflux RND transporter periplasmic adaptor subunit [Acinetobacter tandoii]PJG43451.1 hemolysin D [Acinetobacter tandoii]
MLNLKNKMLNQQGRISQKLLMLLAIGITALLSMGVWWLSQKPSTKEDEHGHAEVEEHAGEDGHGEAEEHAAAIALTAKQLAEQGIQLAVAELGAVVKSTAYPAKLVVNTDRQAHVAPAFAGHVEAVYVELGQQVKKGQALARLLVPDLVDQQASLQVEQSNLELARQDYEREKKLWNEGISAKQDYQRAYNAYQQAQIQVRATRARIAALGAQTTSQGGYVLTAPIAGIISQKDLVLGENVQLADQLFVIDQLDQLWLEFITPSSEFADIVPNQTIEFKSLQSGNLFKAQIQSLNSQADVQTGRLQVRAKVLSNAAELRPNLMVNVQLQQQQAQQGLRIRASAVQKIEGKDAVFVAAQHEQKIEFAPQSVTLGASSSDGQWIEVLSGLEQGQQYAAQGSFLLKSELEKGEASHAH